MTSPDEPLCRVETALVENDDGVDYRNEFVAGKAGQDYGHHAFLHATGCVQILQVLAIADISDKR